MIIGVDSVSLMWIALFEKDNTEEWARNEGNGSRDFCCKVWEYSWKGGSTWYSGGIHIDCRCSSTAEIEVSDAKKVKSETAKLLEKNPFVPTEKIFDHYKKIGGEMMDEELEDGQYRW